MIKLTHQKALNYAKQLYRSNYFSVGDFYKKPSYEKQRAENSIFRQMEKNGGYGYRVLSGNCFTFVAAYYEELPQGKTRLHVETYANSYYYDFD